MCHFTLSIYFLRAFVKLFGPCDIDKGRCLDVHRYNEAGLAFVGIRTIAVSLFLFAAPTVGPVLNHLVTLAGCDRFTVALTKDQIPLSFVSPLMKIEMKYLNRLGTHWHIALFPAFAGDFD